MGVVLALVSSALWGSSDFLGGTLSRRLPPVAVVLGSQCAAFVFLLPVVVVLGAPHDPHGWLVWGLAAGLIGPAALAAFYAALSIGTMGVVAPVSATGAVVPVVAGLLSGERPQPVQLAGIAAALVGVVLASGPELRGTREHTSRGGARALGLALASALGFGLTLVAIAHGARYSVGMTLLTQRSVSVLLALVACAVVRGRTGLGRRDLPLLALVGLGDVTANGLYALATRHGLIAVVSVCASLYPVATVLLARGVHHERLRPVQTVGVVCALAGVAAIAA